MWPFQKQEKKEVIVQNDMVNVVGVYKVKENKDVHLIELMIQASSKDIDVGLITQEDPSQPRDNWQVAYDEYYLDESGEEILGGNMDKPKESIEPCRLAFFFFFIDFEKPLITQFGKVILPKPILMPKRLANIIEFEEP